jgi:hypothetical protein
MRDDLRRAIGDDDLLLVLGTHGPADGAHVSLHAEDHAGFENTGMVVAELDDRVLIHGSTAMRDERIPLLAVPLRHPGAELLTQLHEASAGQELRNALVDERVRRSVHVALLLRGGAIPAQVGPGDVGQIAVRTTESYSPTAHFDPALRDHLAALLPQAPLLATGAGHDAGVLAPHVPTAMLFVRNPTGISHSPEEHAEDADVISGAEALATVMQGLTGRATPE